MSRCCSTCNKEKPEDDFRGARRKCKDCDREYTRKYVAEHRSDPLFKARSIWYGINDRALNKDGRHPTYSDVENRLNKDEFIAWYTANYFDGCSVDRIDGHGHYEITNIRLIPTGLNSSLRNYNKNNHAPEGMHWCNVCKQHKPYADFHKSKGKTHGLCDHCKDCHHAVSKKEWARWKDRHVS